MTHLSRLQLVAVAAGGSALLLGGAFMFQAIGYAPCKMCLWQRWPHAAAILLGLCFVTLPNRLLALLGALAALMTSGIGFFHAGVEQKWWDGPSSCSGSGLTGMSGDQLLSFDTTDTIIMCDDIAWQLLGLSMAGWNAVFSLILAAIWVMAARAKA